MLYLNQPADNRQKYEHMLTLMCSLSRLFSESEKPYLDSRIAENLFCRCLNAVNIARHDCTADATIDQIGIGIKTWTKGTSLQKIAEFNKRNRDYTALRGIELARKIASLRNDRITFTKNNYNLSELIYHYTIRDRGSICILEDNLVPINIATIEVEREQDHILLFNDGENTYSFNRSKSVLQKRFDESKILSTLNIQIEEDPFGLLEELLSSRDVIIAPPVLEHIYLPLYSPSEGDVPQKSQLNHWNANSNKRARKPDEAYIPIPAEVRKAFPKFFPYYKNNSFKLLTPDGKSLLGRVRQQDFKALMTNPNADLGKWLLRKVLGLAEGELLTMDKLENLGIDSVIIEKIDEQTYKINFAKLGSYARFMRGVKNV